MDHLHTESVVNILLQPLHGYISPTVDTFCKETPGKPAKMKHKLACLTMKSMILLCNCNL